MKILIVRQLVRVNMEHAYPQSPKPFNQRNRFKLEKTCFYLSHRMNPLFGGNRLDKAGPVLSRVMYYMRTLKIGNENKYIYTDLT